MKTLIKEVNLRNCHRVYQDNHDYQVEQISNKVSYSYSISRQVVDYLFNQLQGSQVDVKEAVNILKPVANKLNLPFTYGYKLEYYTQEILVVLVAINKASVEKEGKKYLYYIG